VSSVQMLLRDRSYTIRIVPGGLSDVGIAVRKEGMTDRAIVLTTPRVAREHYAALEAALERADLEPTVIDVPDGERAKTLRTASRIYDHLAELEVERGTPIVGLGGGALCDLAGFVASTYLRGLPVVYVPTTLRAQVDTSVGGKTALHHRSGSNRIGTFYPPSLVWVDPHLLLTLPSREIRSGMAEVIKVAAIWDAEFFAWLEAKIAGLLALNLDPIVEAATRAIQIRAEIVGLDQRSAGLRALLQFGERFADVVRARDPEVGAGEASAMGMQLAARLSARRGWIEGDSVARIGRLLQKVGLPAAPADWNEQKEAYLRALADDKKHVPAMPGWVLLRALGRAERAEVGMQELFAEMQ